MSEFVDVVERFSPKAFPVGEVVVPFALDIPQKARVLDCYQFRADDGQQSTSLHLDGLPVKFGMTSLDLDGFRVKFGIFRTEEQWVEHAKTLEHPFDSVQGLRPDVSVTVASLLASSPGQVLQHRRLWIEHLKQMAAEFRNAEERLHAALPVDVGNILRGKQLGLLSYLMQAAGCKDTELWRDISGGFSLVGVLARSHEFEQDFKPASIEVQDLLSMAAPIIAKARHSTRASDDAELDAEVWRATLKERDKKWVSGPLTEEDLNRLYPQGWIPSRRFGIRQKQKTRVIDDFSASYVNATVHVTEKLKLESVDEFLGMAKVWMQQVINQSASWQADGVDDVSDRWTVDMASDLLARTFDLKSAYRQLPVSEDSKRFSVIVVWDPEAECPRYFQLHALPFGSVSSVYSFNRLSVAIRHIMMRLFLIPSCCYFDDYPTLSPRVLTDSAASTFQEVMSILGWQLSEDEDKSLDYSPVADMLGVRVDLSRVREDAAIYVCNKPGRIADCLEIVEQSLVNGIDGPTAASLKGKLHFMEGQHFNKLGCVALGALGRVVKASGIPNPGSELHGALSWLKAAMLDRQPRRILVHSQASPTLIFTDGCCEGESYEHVGIGGLMFHPASSRPEFFHAVLPEDLVKSWQRATGKDQVIYLAEILPVAVAKRVWHKELRSSSCLWFIDNMAARAAILGSTSSDAVALKLIWHMLKLDAESGARNFYEWIPSSSNPADGPSRGKSSMTSQRWDAIQVAVDDHISALTC
eukprot:4469354-Amphidinium_carterae.1